MKPSHLLRLVFWWAGRAALYGLAAGLVVFAVLPIGALVWRTLDHQSWQHVTQNVIQEAILLSLFTTAVSMGVILLFGTPLAYLLARREFRGKRAVAIAMQMPIVLPPAVAGLALLMTFGRQGVLNPVLSTLDIQIVFTQTAVILAQVFVGMPFYVRSAQVGFAQVDQQVEESALVDGATAWWCFVYVTVPLASRALVSGALLSWARTLGEFGATILFAGNLQGRTQTMPLLIYSIFERNVDAAIWTALLLVALAALILVLLHVVAREAEVRVE